MPSETRRILGDIYGDELIGAMRDAVLDARHRGDVKTARQCGLVLAFLEGRLSEAARAGCHHCDEERNGRGAPCHWCGLVYSRRRI